MEAIELSYVTITYEAPIVYFIYKPGTQIGFPEVKELISYAEKISNYQPYVTFSDATVDMNITEEGKKYVADLNNMPLFRGTAALVKNTMYQFGANIFYGFGKKKYPFRAFTVKEEAIKWLLSLPLQ